VTYAAGCLYNTSDSKCYVILMFTRTPQSPGGRALKRLTTRAFVVALGTRLGTIHLPFLNGLSKDSAQHDRVPSLPDGAMHRLLPRAGAGGSHLACSTSACRATHPNFDLEPMLKKKRNWLRTPSFTQSTSQLTAARELKRSRLCRSRSDPLGSAFPGSARTMTEQKDVRTSKSMA